MAVTIKDDKVEDIGDTFRFTLSSPTTASLVSLSDAEATVTIINDEADLEGLKLWGAPGSGGPYARLDLGAFERGGIGLRGDGARTGRRMRRWRE